MAATRNALRATALVAMAWLLQGCGGEPDTDPPATPPVEATAATPGLKVRPLEALVERATTPGAGGLSPLDAAVAIAERDLSHSGVLAALLELTASPDAAIAKVAADRLSQVDPARLDLVAGAVCTAPPSAWMTGVDILVGFGDRGVEPLVLCVRTGGGDLPTLAAMGLTRLGIPGIGAVVEMLDDPTTAATAKSALLRAGPQVLPILCEREGSPGAAAVLAEAASRWLATDSPEHQQVREMPNPARDSIARRLPECDGAVVVSGWHLIEELPEARAVPLLLGLLRHPGPKVRGLTANRLVMLGSDAHAALLDDLEQRHEPEAASGVLASIGGDQTDFCRLVWRRFAVAGNPLRSIYGRWLASPRVGCGFWLLEEIHEGNAELDSLAREILADADVDALEPLVTRWITRSFPEECERRCSLYAEDERLNPLLARITCEPTLPETGWICAEALASRAPSERVRAILRTALESDIPVGALRAVVALGERAGDLRVLAGTHRDSNDLESAALAAAATLTIEEDPSGFFDRLTRYVLHCSGRRDADFVTGSVRMLQHVPEAIRGDEQIRALAHDLVRQCGPAPRSDIGTAGLMRMVCGLHLFAAAGNADPWVAREIALWRAIMDSIPIDHPIHMQVPGILGLINRAAAVAGPGPAGDAVTPRGGRTRVVEKKARDAADLALRWLVSAQRPDGSWPARSGDLVLPPETYSAADEASELRVGVTALAVLCFQARGHTHLSSEYGTTVSRGLAFLLTAQDEDGCFGSRAGQRFQFGHAIATLAVADASRRSGDPLLRPLARRAIEFIAASRNPDLAWRYGVRDGENDTAVTAWMALALARFRGQSPPQDEELVLVRNCMRGAIAWIDQMTEIEFGRIGYRDRGGPPARYELLHGSRKFPAERSESTTAAGIVTRMLCGENPERSPAIRKGGAILAGRIPYWDRESGEIDMHYWFWGSLAADVIGGTHRVRWRRALLAEVLPKQRPRGSWPPVGVWGMVGGEVYSTSMLTLALLAHEGPIDIP